MSQVCVILCTFPSEDKAGEVARTLVEERLVACVNVLAGARSIYRWKDEVQEEPEVLTVMKTTSAGFDALEKRLAQLHPYECPEILAVDVNSGHGPYLEWVVANVG